ncbi:insulinase family protein [candidate division KSB1 bacterium]|nr:insulinase family protein [candidate division KSB1 bacterium]
MVVVSVLVLTGLGLAQKQLPPEGSEPKDFILPEKETFSLDNGLKVTLVHYGSIPKVNVRFVVRAGNINESENEVWLADLTTDYLNEGTTSKTAKQVAESAAQIGGSINTTCRPDLISVSGEALAEYTPELIKLLSDVIINPLFPESELERLKNNFLRNLQVLKSQPESLADEKFHKVLYGTHPYGRFFPTEEMLSGYSIEQVKQFYQNNFGAQRTHLYIAGMFNTGKVKSAIRKNLNNWNKGEPFSGDLPKPVSDRAVYLIDRPGSSQSTVIIGLPVIDPTHQDYVPLQVADALLGGAFASRITMNIREDKGYTYSPNSLVNTHYRDANWAEYASVATDVTGPALKEIFYEINRLQNEPPDEIELKGIQNYLAGIFVLRNSSRNGIINQLAFMDLHGLDDSYLNSFVQRIFQTTPEDIQRLCKTYLVQDKMSIIIVGDGQKVKPQVGEFGELIQ